jgi:uncharacterized SAM-binding protein YcdF (DUF218 family)
MTEYSVVLFDSTAHAIRAEQLLQRAGLRIKMIPTPRQLSSDCGMALRFNRAEEGRIAGILEENRVPARSIHAIQARR